MFTKQMAEQNRKAAKIAEELLEAKWVPVFDKKYSLETGRWSEKDQEILAEVVAEISAQIPDMPERRIRGQASKVRTRLYGRYFAAK